MADLIQSPYKRARVKGQPESIPTIVGNGIGGDQIFTNSEFMIEIDKDYLKNPVAPTEGEWANFASLKNYSGFDWFINLFVHVYWFDKQFSPEFLYRKYTENEIGLSSHFPTDTLRSITSQEFCLKVRKMLS